MVSAGDDRQGPQRPRPLSGFLEGGQGPPSTRAKGFGSSGRERGQRRTPEPPHMMTG